MSYKEWMAEVGTLIRKESTNTKGWKTFCSWRDFYDEDLSPEEAVDQSGFVS